VGPGLTGDIRVGFDAGRDAVDDHLRVYRYCKAQDNGERRLGANHSPQPFAIRRRVVDLEVMAENKTR